MQFGWINIFGGIFVILLLIPNIINWKKIRERETTDLRTPVWLKVFEQIGRYGCIIFMWLPLLKWEFGFGSVAEMEIYIFLNLALIVLYYLVWSKYVKNFTYKNAMMLAVIPTVIFFISGILLRHWLLVLAAIIFGISHIMITKTKHVM